MALRTAIQGLKEWTTFFSTLHISEDSSKKYTFFEAGAKELSLCGIANQPDSLKTVFGITKAAHICMPYLGTSNS